MRIASNRIPERLNLDKSEVEEEKVYPSYL